nr:MAG TPA: tail assembly chaperone [Caudoviricetes sp.]
MSQWKWNDVELEIDMDDVEFLERYEKVFESIEPREKNLEKVGKISEITREYCLLFYDIFDGIFGEGTSEKLFDGKMNLRVCEECYDSFISVCEKEINAVNKRRNSVVSKYTPNRAQRRAKK